MTLIAVRLHRFVAQYTTEAGLNLLSRDMARFTVSPNGSEGNILRNVMFLDEEDLLVIGIIEGEHLSTTAKYRSLSL
jgi:hypothetical protein